MDRETALESVGSGWGSIINKLYDAKPQDVSVIQVKEKFGTLRFYVGYAPEWYHDLIDYYEKLSATICERCGAKGTLRTERSWILTLCDKCNDEIK